jgi:hypothetical protein
MANITFSWKKKLFICVLPQFFVYIEMKNCGKYSILVATKTFYLCFAMIFCLYRDEKSWKI